MADATVDNQGSGHVEAWYARQPGHAHIWTVAPAYAPVDGIEFGAALSRDHTADLTTGAIQAKWRITASQEAGLGIGTATYCVKRASFPLRPGRVWRFL